MKINQSKSRLKYLSPDEIDINPENPRMIFRQEELDHLLLSIKEHGIQVPIAVYQEGSKYRLIDGERRWRCALKLNLKEIPALIQDKPTELQNLLLMYNIHSLREQWDYFTIAKSLSRIIELFESENGWVPNEIELAEATGLTRGQIRRCNLIIDLPEKYKNVIQSELEKPKFQQKVSEDFFIEMERSLKTVFKRVDDYVGREDQVRDALIVKFREGKIGAVTDFRMLSKIATAIDNIGIKEKATRKTLDKIFDPNNDLSIKQAYQETVEFDYDEIKAKRHIDNLNEFLDSHFENVEFSKFDDDFIKSLSQLKLRINRILAEKK